MEGFVSKLKNLDAYPKVNEDFFQRTLSGGIITIGSSIIMLCLFLSELSELFPLLPNHQDMWRSHSSIEASLLTSLM